MVKLTELPWQAIAKAQQLVERGSAEVHYAQKMFGAGAFRLEPPQHIAAMVADIVKWGEFGMIPALNARRHPNRTAVIDDFGEMTFGELNDAAHSVANGLIEKGVKGGDGVALLARNHRWFWSRSTAPPGSGPGSSCSTASSPDRRSKRCPSARVPS